MSGRTRENALSVSTAELTYLVRSLHAAVDRKFLKLIGCSAMEGLERLPMLERMAISRI